MLFAGFPMSKAQDPAEYAITQSLTRLTVLTHGPSESLIIVEFVLARV